MSGPGEEINIRELVEPIKSYIRGVCALIHDADSFDAGSQYLLKVNDELGGGNVIFGPYTGRHDASRNRILYETGIKENEWYLQTDLLEHPRKEFLEKVPEIIKQNPSLNCLFYYGKPYLVKFTEWLKYDGTPHESLKGIRGQSVEYSQIEPDESKVRQNMRPLKRKDRLHFVGHYAKYYFLPGSNQCLLGLDHRPNDSFERRMALRDHLKKYMLDKGLDFSLNSFIDMVKREGIYHELKKYINHEKILQDVVRLNVMKETDIQDEHAWTTMKTY
jgi:hypothetical protein